MHVLNKLLPSIEIDAISSNDEESKRLIIASLNSIKKSMNDETSPSVKNTEIGKLTRLVNVHSKLKYEFKKDLMDDILNLLHQVHFSNLITIPIKTKVLKVMKTLCKKGENGFELTFRFSWKSFWDIIMLISSREDRHEISASEHVVSAYLTSLVDFLHSSRSYISYSGLQDTTDSNNPIDKDYRIDSVENLVNIATVKLQDTRYSTCIEGVLMLINCLPSNYPQYEKCLSQWVDLWIGNNALNDNPHWDYAWLTLLARARKYCPTNPVMMRFWCNLLPLFLTKSQELLRVPASTVIEGARSCQNSEFPHNFHPHYSRLLLVQYSGQPAVDARGKALAKVAKLIHFVTIQNDCRDNKPALVSPVYASITPSLLSVSALTSAKKGIDLVTSNSVEFIAFLQSLRTFFYPSNSDSWTQSLAHFFLIYIYQLCRHTGYELVSAIADDETTVIPRSKQYLAKLHLPTVHYLVLNLLPYCMEGLYSKNPVMSTYCSSCLKNLLAINPKLFAPIVLPFLLAALDPSAVSQVHQAPIVLQTLSSCFRSLMFPQPILLQYLPEIFKLSLSGIEASDVRKTSITLHLYSTVLAWIPTTSVNYFDEPLLLPSYLHVIQKKTNDVQLGAVLSNGAELTSSEIASQIQILSEYISTEWSDSFIKKIFVLLEAQEAPLENTSPSPLSGAIGQCASYLFQALRPLHYPGDADIKKKGIWEIKQQQQTELRKEIQNKVKHFFQTSTPLNADKASAKLMEAMVTADPSILTLVLNELLAPTSGASLLESYSPDKVAFRLRLAGGATRSATAVEIVKNLSLLQPIVTSTLYFNHEEKIVRTAVGKLLKDMLKGATSFYPMELEPIYATNIFNPICSPNTRCLENLRWHIPSIESIVEIIKLIKEVISEPMTVIRDLCITISSKYEVDNIASNAASIKKTEELILSKFSMIHRAIRGIAEILGDANSHSSDHNDVVDVNLLSTGRSELIQSLDSSCSLYLQSLRFEILETLYFFQESIHSIGSSSSHPMHSLKNNSMIQESWIRIFNIIVTQRMACLKNVDSISQMLKQSVKMSRTSITNVVYKTLKLHNKIKNGPQKVKVLDTITDNIDDWKMQLMQVEFWRYHDTSTSAIACLAWVQHVRRCQQLSFASVRLYTVDEDPFMKCVGVLVEKLCKHEYDSIRKIAVKGFEIVGTRFAFKMAGLVHTLLSNLTTDQKFPLTYYSASGTLSLLGQSRVQTKIIGDVELLSFFLNTILLHTQDILLAATSEPDKQEKLLRSLVHVLLIYLKHWTVFTTQDENGFMLNLALKCVGFTSESQDSSLENKSEGKTNSITGLRLETFVAFMVLHTIGRTNTSLSSTASNADTITSVWKWVIQTLCNPQLHGQPVQTISLAALSRLAWITKLESQSEYPEKSKCYSLGIDFVRRYLSPLGSECCLKSIIISASQTHPKLSDDGLSAQWGKGIDSMMQAAKFLGIVVPRKFYGLASNQMYSKNFRKEDAAMYMSLAQAGLLGNDITETFTKSNLTALFAYTRDLPAANEGEKLTNNATKAELFAGVLRAYRSHNISEDINNDVEKVFLEYLREHVDKASLDYCCAWQEALYFAYGDKPVYWKKSSSSDDSRIEELIPAFILENLEKFLFKQTQGTTVLQDDESVAVDQTTESFSSQTNMIKLACSLLEADQEACFSMDQLQSADPRQSVIGQALVNVLNTQADDASLISPFHTIRKELCSLIAILALNKSQGQFAPVITLCQKISNVCGDLNNKCNNLEVSQITDTEENRILTFSTQFHKNAAETVCFLIQHGIHSLPILRLNDAWVSLLHTALIAAGSVSVLETARMCHNSCMLIANNVNRNSTNIEDIHDDLCLKVLEVFEKQSKIDSTSLHSKETLVKCVILLMGNNWHSLNNIERKTCKDIFSRCIDDVKPEVQQLSQAGMVAYLSYKTLAELTAIAIVYTKNSDVLADREKKSKKLQSKNEANGGTVVLSGKVDLKHQNTVMMISCVLLSTPYDLPIYLPALITSLCRHASIASLRDTVTRTIQLFKRTHQDRWSEFKESFTIEQLDELQGTGAAHYYS